MDVKTTQHTVFAIWEKSFEHKSVRFIFQNFKKRNEKKGDSNNSFISRTNRRRERANLAGKILAGPQRRDQFSSSAKRENSLHHAEFQEGKRDEQVLFILSPPTHGLTKQSRLYKKKKKKVES